MADKVSTIQPTTAKQNLISTIITSIVHGIVLIVLLLFLICIVPKFMEVFAKLGGQHELPFPTILMLNISTVLNTYWYLVPTEALFALALNAWIYYSLRSRFISKLPSNLYRGTVLIAMLLCLAILILSVFLPLMKVQEMLNK